MGGSFSAHIRANVVGYAALFVALSGSALALPGRNSVDSGDIRNGQVKRPDIARNSVNGARIANGGVGSADIADGSLGSSDIDDGSLGSLDIAGLTGEDIDESTLFNDNSLGSADIAGLTGGDITADSLGGAQIGESSLAQVPSAALAALANLASDADELEGKPLAAVRTVAAESSDDPNPDWDVPIGATWNDFIEVGTVDITLTTTSTLIAFAGLDLYTTAAAAPFGQAVCVLLRNRPMNSQFFLGQLAYADFASQFDDEQLLVAGADVSLPPDTYTVRVKCRNEHAASGPVKLATFDLAVVAIPTG